MSYTLRYRMFRLMDGEKWFSAEQLSVQLGEPMNRVRYTLTCAVNDYQVKKRKSDVTYYTITAPADEILLEAPKLPMTPRQWWQI